MDFPEGQEVGSWAQYDELAPALKEVAVKLEVGEHSSVITSDDGYYLILLDKTQETRPKPYEEVREQLIKQLQTEDAPLFMKEEAHKFYNEYKSSGKTLAEFAATKSLPSNTTWKMVTIKDASPELEQPIIERALNLYDGDKEVITTENASYIVEIHEIIEQVIPELNTVKPAVRANFEKEESKANAVKFAEELNAKALESKNLAKVATQFAQTAKDTKLAKISETNEEFLTAPEFREKAFSLTKENPQFDKPITLGDYIYVVQLKDISLPSPEEFEKNKKALMQKASNQAGERMIAILLEHLKAKSNIWINPDM